MKTMTITRMKFNDLMYIKNFIGRLCYEWQSLNVIHAHSYLISIVQYIYIFIHINVTACLQLLWRFYYLLWSCKVYDSLCSRELSSVKIVSRGICRVVGQCLRAFVRHGKRVIYIWMYEKGEWWWDRKISRH